MSIDIKKIGTAIKNVIVKIESIGDKVKKILQAEEALEPAFLTGLSTLATNTSTFISVAGTAVTAEGMNFPEDSAAYAALVKLISDFKSFEPTVEQGIKNLLGDTTTTTTTTTAATPTAATTSAVVVIEEPTTTTATSTAPTNTKTSTTAAPATSTEAATDGTAQAKSTTADWAASYAPAAPTEEAEPTATLQTTA